ncbi:DUF6879 family protein [Streptomyces brevispora]|uniref:DUF6879 family protein n=1 Tax=Streptomyces brevispora TaxID=887462 RepID=UPI00398CEF99
MAVGEDIRTLPRATADALGLLAEDFWIFDSRVVALRLRRRGPRDIEEAVRARMRRQDLLNPRLSTGRALLAPWRLRIGTWIGPTGP